MDGEGPKMASQKEGVQKIGGRGEAVEYGLKKPEWWPWLV